MFFVCYTTLPKTQTYMNLLGSVKTEHVNSYCFTLDLIFGTFPITCDRTVESLSNVVSMVSDKPQNMVSLVEEKKSLMSRKHKQTVKQVFNKPSGQPKLFGDRETETPPQSSISLFGSNRLICPPDAVFTTCPYINFLFSLCSRPVRQFPFS